MFLGVVAAFAVSSQHPYFAIFWADPAPVYAILAATLLIVVVGVADDLWDLDWMIKLGAQFLAAGIIAWFGQLQIFSLPIGGLIVGSSWVSFTLTVFSIVVVMNAVNFIDGLDGLVAGRLPHRERRLLRLLLHPRARHRLEHVLQPRLVHRRRADRRVHRLPAAELEPREAVHGRLRRAHARAAHGDARRSRSPASSSRPCCDPEGFGRSQLLGAFIPILLPVVVVLLPLLDFGLAVVRRMSAGKSPFSPDRKHLHHRMLDMGHTDRDAVLIFYAWTAVFSLAVLLMYIGTRENWPGQYLIGVAFGVVGAAACLVVTLLPSWRRKPAVLAPSDDAPTLEAAR